MRTDSGRPFLETLPSDPAASVAVSHMRLRRFTFGWHYHPEAELTLIVKGSGLRFVGDSIETFEPGDLVLLGGGVPHTWQSQAGDRMSESVYAQFPASLLGDGNALSISNLPELSALRALMRDASQGLHVAAGRARNEAAGHLTRAASARAGSVGRLIALLAALDVLSAHRAALRPLSDQPVAEQPSDAAARAIRRVMDRLRQSIATGDLFTQADAAALVGRSPASFSRFFRQHVGRSFVRYVNEWRVGLACRALMQTDDDITSIAFDCGFSNLSNFNRRFRQIKGIAPRAFRRARPPRGAAAL